MRPRSSICRSNSPPPITRLEQANGKSGFKDFWATEAALNTVMLAYNLMSLFRQVLLKTTVVKGGVSTPIQHTLQTLRYKLFAKPAYTTTEGRKQILNLAMAMQHRQWMKGLWDEATQFDLPVKFTAHHPTGTG